MKELHMSVLYGCVTANEDILEDILDGKKFWKTIKPLFLEKVESRNKITLIEGDQIITKDA